MRMPFGVKRRRFLQIVAVLAYSGAGVSRASEAYVWKIGEIDPLAEKLAGFFCNKESANIVGSVVLAMESEHRGISELLESLCGDQPTRYEQLLLADDSSLRQIIMEQQRADFTCGRTRAVDGWILSETEVQLCALSEMVSRVRG